MEDKHDAHWSNVAAPFAGLIQLVANFWRSQNHVLCETCHGKVTCQAFFVNRIFYVYFWALSFHTDEQSGDCEKHRLCMQRSFLQ